MSGVCVCVGCRSAARVVETLISHPSLLCVTSGGRQSRALPLEAALTIDLPGEHLRPLDAIGLYTWFQCLHRHAAPGLTYSQTSTCKQTLID